VKRKGYKSPYFGCKSLVDDNMLRTPPRQSLLHLMVQTDFVTDVHWNNNTKHHQLLMHYVEHSIPVRHADVHYIDACVAQYLMQ